MGLCKACFPIATKQHGGLWRVAVCGGSLFKEWAPDRIDCE